MLQYLMLGVPGSVKRPEWVDRASEKGRMVKGREVTLVGDVHNPCD